MHLIVYELLLFFSNLIVIIVEILNLLLFLTIFFDLCKKLLLMLNLHVIRVILENKI